MSNRKERERREHVAVLQGKIEKLKKVIGEKECQLKHAQNVVCEKQLQIDAMKRTVESSYVANKLLHDVAAVIYKFTNLRLDWEE